MQFEVFTLLPEVFPAYIDTSIIKRARERGLINVRVHNIRDYTHDKHHMTDDTPYGGGAGMVTNRRHELVKLTDLDKRLVPLLDGTRTRPELVEALVADALAGLVQVARNNKPVTGDAAVRDALTAVLDPALTVLAGHAETRKAKVA